MPRRPPANLTRYDHNYFHGWVVEFKRAGEIHVEYLKDDGGRRAARRRAIAWRDRVLATLSPPRRFHRRSSTSTTGVVGVIHSRTHTRKGTPVEYYCATWTTEDGRPHQRKFSVLKYGLRRAFAMARDVRATVIAEMLQPRKLGRSTPSPRWA